MTEWRADPVTGRWTIVGADVPLHRTDFDAGQAAAPPANGACPLCEGHEDDTAGEILAVRDGTRANQPGWMLRVVPNGVPILRTERTFEPREDEWPPRADGLGAHEVIVESPAHGDTWARMDEAALARVLVAWRERIADLSRDRRLRAVVVFKNHGVQAGARLAHPHSQLVAMPLVPPALAEELEGAAAYHAAKGTCVYCDLLSRDVDDGTRLVLQSPGVVVLSPFAARTPFQLWLLPRLHEAHFERAGDALLREVAGTLRTLLDRVEAYLEGPAYNVVLHTAPYGPSADTSFHWHIEIVPRVYRVTGLDLGAGLSINPVLPEEAARVLRRARKGGGA